MSVCWCGDDHEPHCPTCDKCGAPITTGFMVFFCPARMQCEFYDPEWDEDTKKHLFQTWLNQDKLRPASSAK
jgi:hypothetical protein